MVVVKGAVPSGFVAEGYCHAAKEGIREGLWDWEVRKETGKATLKNDN